MLHATGPRSGGKMAALAKFLGKEVPMRAGVGGEIEFPHVKTPSAHWVKTDVPPPADELDPNEDLWGRWSGGVPAGKLKSGRSDYPSDLPSTLGRLVICYPHAIAL